MARPSQPPDDMQARDFDDYILAGLLLFIGLPRAILAVMFDRPLGVEGTLSLVAVALALLVLLRRATR